jgi:hypothetical protein
VLLLIGSFELSAQGPGNATGVVVQRGVGQSVTLAIFASSATDPNTDTPVGTPVEYVFQSCGFVLGAEAPPLTDPDEGFWEHPEGSGVECRINLTTQMAALAPGSYKAALKIGAGTYGALSSTFTVT